MRNFGIDFLRGIAVLLVLIHHAFDTPENSDNLFFNLFNALKRAGWMGVDLFFVLSGFLVSGLLFKEFQRYQKIDPVHFLIRRGFKIYPAYFLLLAITPFILPWAAPQWAYLSEGLFVQNYGPRLWNHTWSLAVEEHFYLAAAFLLPLSLNGKRRGERLPLIIPCFCALVFFLRLFTQLTLEFSNQSHLFATHLRIDALLFGMLLSYFYYLRKDVWEKLTSKVSIFFVLGATLALLPNFIWEIQNNFYIGTFGFTLNYLAFGVLLLAALQVGFRSEQMVTKLISIIGFYSYSIYLWHIPIKWKMYFWLKRFPFFSQNYWLSTVFYLLVAVVLGILLGKLVEIPFLKVRDRLFPSRSEK